VILRVINGQVRSGELDSVAASYRRTYVPVAEKLDGLARFVIAVRDGADGVQHLAAMTLWTTVDAALAAYGGDLAAIRTVDAAEHGEVLVRVDYYEVEDTAGPGPAEEPVTLLRLTAGRVARGLDAEIQQELRRNLPSLPAEARESWVGRRVLDSDVEIAFVSTWTSGPGDGSLEEPMWPSISARYDSFRVEVLRILIEGSGRA
jgi:hypothetical protein